MASKSLECRENFAAAIKSCKGDVEVLQAAFIDTPGMEADKKSILEQAFRDVLQEKIVAMKSNKTDPLTNLVLLTNASAELGISLYTVPFILLGDIFDCLTLDVCESVFSFVESQVSTWVSPEFYSSGKILLLRMCNDLLRRLSSAQNTVFCGRIQLFLSQLFPLSEKSALNLMSHFNLENVTTYTDDEELLTTQGVSNKDGATAMDTNDGTVGSSSDDKMDTNAPVDFNLYRKLWSIQDFFRQPTQCYTADQWKVLTENMGEIFRAFGSYKLEEEASSQSRKKKGSSGVQYSEPHYFAKFLTSEKLMNLQLRDSHFRRHVLVQCLILFQYLTSDVKFKSPSLVLLDAQVLWIRDTTETVYQLLRETPPNGEEFALYIQQALKREESWITWKNEGCPSFEKEPQSVTETNQLPEKQHLGDMDNSKIDIGSNELSRLWNLCPSNINACKQKGRIFMPEKSKFLEEPLEQADPEAQIEAQYKVVTKPNFMWQALRLLSTSSPHFFQNTTAAIKPLPDYLEHVILQEGKDLQQQQQQTQMHNNTTTNSTENHTPASTAS